MIPQEHGFRAGHSTTDQLTRLTTQATVAFNMSQHTGVLLLDISKAFNRVWHEGLILKLLQGPGVHDSVILQPETVPSSNQWYTL